MFDSIQKHDHRSKNDPERGVFFSRSVSFGVSCVCTLGERKCMYVYVSCDLFEHASTSLHVTRQPFCQY